MTNSRSKNKILVFIILLLLVTNLAVLGYFLFLCKKPEKNKSRDFITVLQKEIGFDNQQITQFNELKKSHWQQAKAKMDKIINIKNTIFDLSKQADTPDSIIEKLADSIGALQKDVEINAYRHVVATRKICRADQQPAYDALMKKIINKGRTGKPEYAPPPPPPAGK